MEPLFKQVQETMSPPPLSVYAGSGWSGDFKMNHDVFHFSWQQTYWGCQYLVDRADLIVFLRHFWSLKSAITRQSSLITWLCFYISSSETTDPLREHVSRYVDLSKDGTNAKNKTKPESYLNVKIINVLGTSTLILYFNLRDGQGTRLRLGHTGLNKTLFLVWFRFRKSYVSREKPKWG